MAKAQLLGSAAAALVDLLFPPSCGACRAPMPRLALLCADCSMHATAVAGARCDRCGLPGAATQCPDGALQPADASGAGFDRARALFVYGGPLEEALGRVKFGQAPHLAVAAGHALARHLQQLGPGAAAAEIDLVTAVPVGAARLRQRGYDQAVLMAGPVARALRRPGALHLLQRQRETRAQAQLGRAERRANVAGAFAVRGADLRGLRLLLVDDVLTTGATCHAAATALKQAGAARVEVLTLARAALDDG